MLFIEIIQIKKIYCSVALKPLERKEKQKKIKERKKKKKRKFPYLWRAIPKIQAKPDLTAKYYYCDNTTNCNSDLKYDSKSICCEKRMRA